MIRSMTGFGRSQSEADGLDLVVEISAVNRRNLEISVAIPREWQSLEREIQSIARDSVSRGKLNITIQGLPAGLEAGFHWDDAGLDASLHRLGEVAARHRVAWPPDADALVRLAALNKVDAVLPPVDAVSSRILEEVKAAFSGLLEMREREGAALGADLAARMKELARLLAGISELSVDTVPRYRELLLQRLRQADLEIDLSDERVLKELAIFADKCDTSEEQTRLESHFTQFGECLDAGSPVGRKLEFIVQEMNREFNTIGSKANNIDVNRLVIDAKNEIERIREQIQNIE